MTPLADATSLLSKAVRTSDIARTSDALQMPVNQLDRYAQGTEPFVIWGNTYPDKLDAIAEYFYQGHRRYDAESDTLISTHEAETLPMPIGMPASEVERAIKASYREPREDYKGLVEWHD